MSYFLNSPELSSASSSARFDSNTSLNSMSTSFSFVQPYSGLAKLRLDCCRGFEVEDDQEFCPALVAPLTTQFKYKPSYIASVAPFALSASSMPVAESADPSVPTLTVSAKKTLQIIDPSTGMPVSRA